VPESKKETDCEAGTSEKNLVARNNTVMTEAVVGKKSWGSVARQLTNNETAGCPRVCATNVYPTGQRAGKFEID